MKLAAVAGLTLLAAAAAILLLFVLSTGGSEHGNATALLPTHTATPPAPTPTPSPPTWVEALHGATGDSVLIACLDRNADHRIDAADGPDTADLAIPLVEGNGCADAAEHRDYYSSPPYGAAAFRCDAPRPPWLIVLIPSAGSDLIDTEPGESLGLLQAVNELQPQIAAAGVGYEIVIAAPAVIDAGLPQTRMEQWLEHDLRRRLDALPCLRVVLLGHSHGGVTVTAVTAVLESDYPGRLYGVILDRTIVLYDHGALEYPVETPLLNVYQLNEGWHGHYVDLPNITNVDESAEYAPLAQSDGGGGLALVSHKTLDDSVAVQKLIEATVMAWIAP